MMPRTKKHTYIPVPPTKTRCRIRPNPSYRIQLLESLLQLSEPQLPESLPDESHQLPESDPEEESHQLPESEPELDEESHQLLLLPEESHQEPEELLSDQLDDEVEPDPSGLPITQQPMTIRITPITNQVEALLIGFIA